MSRVQQVCANAIILNNKNEILLVKRSLRDEFLPGYWELPGGGIDYGEIPQEGLQREVKQECGLNVEVSKPLAVNTYYIEEVQRIEITFLCNIIDADYSIRLSSEHNDYKWVNTSQINSINVTSYIKDIIKASKDWCE